MSLPAPAPLRIKLLLLEWSKRHSRTLTERQSIVESLQFASTSVPTGRLFIRQMINLLPDARASSGRVQLNADSAQFTMV